LHSRGMDAVSYEAMPNRIAVQELLQIWQIRRSQLAQRRGSEGVLVGRH